MLRKLWNDIDEIVESEGLSCKKDRGCDGSCCNILKANFQPTVLPLDIPVIKEYISIKRVKSSKVRDGSCVLLDNNSKC